MRRAKTNKPESKVRAFRRIHPRSRMTIRRKRAGQRGMTLIEIMVVVAIIAVVGGSAAVVAFNFLGDAKEKTAAEEARTIKSAATVYRFDSATCPTVDDLIADGKIDADTNTDDPWGGAYEVDCQGDNVVVSSAGPDGEWDTDDDISTRRRREDG